MVLLQKELSSLAVESLEIGVHVRESEQDRSLDTLTTPGEVEIAAIWKSTTPVNEDACCCCCCPACCCC